MSGDQPTLEMGLLRGRLEAAVTAFMSTVAASGGNYPQAAADASASLAEEIAKLVGAVADPAARFGITLELIQLLPGAVEGVHAAAVAEQRTNRARRPN